MNSRVLLGLVVLFFSLNVSAQQPDSTAKPDFVQKSATAKPPESAQPREMEEWLDSGDAQEKVERLVSLGVEPEEAAELTRTANAYAHWILIRTGSRRQNAILFLPCIRDNAHIYLLAHENESWHVTDMEKPDCHSDDSVSIEIAPILNSAFEEVLVHHVGAGHGAGVSMQDFNVFAVSDGKLRIELDAEEAVNIFRPHLHSYERYDLIQRSTFVLIPTSHSHSRVIEETRSTTLNDKLTVQRRQFRWNASKGRYLPSKFSLVEATPND